MKRKEKPKLAYISIDFRNSFPFKALVEAGLLPDNCVRFILDSGPPDGVAKIYFDSYADDKQCEALVSVLLAAWNQSPEADSQVKQ